MSHESRFIKAKNGALKTKVCVKLIIHLDLLDSSLKQNKTKKEFPQIFVQGKKGSGQWRGASLSATKRTHLNFL